MNKLTLITVAYKYDFLDKLWLSVPKYDDVEWTIVKVKDRNLDKWKNIYRINVVEVDTSEDFEGVFVKMQAGLDSVKDGWFMKLDEDTVFHPNAYKMFKKYNSNPAMLIGSQYYCNDTLRIKANIGQGATDSGNVMCHNECLKEVKWTTNTKDIAQDQTFWGNCFNYYKIGRTYIIDEPISYYNYQLNQIDEQDIYKKE